MTRTSTPIRELPPQQLLERELRVALQSIDRGESSLVEHFARAMMAVEALPLTTGEFATAKAKLVNARHYVAQNEPGAARYELNSLLRRLPRLLPEIKAWPIVQGVSATTPLT